MLKYSEYVKKHTWHEMMNSAGLDGYSNYIGPNHGSLIVVLGQSRDSELLEQSNFASALEMLGGESKDVEVIRDGHWACGWVERILVNPKNKKKSKIAYEIYKKLQEYGVLDEDDYSNRQSEYYAEFANDHKVNTAEGLAKHFKVKLSKKLIQIAYDLQMEDQYQGGEGSCLNIYECREPDRHDCEDLFSAMEGIKYEHKNSRVFKELWNSLAVYRARFLELKAGAK